MMEIIHQSVDHGHIPTQRDMHEQLHHGQHQFHQQSYPEPNELSYGIHPNPYLEEALHAM